MVEDNLQEGRSPAGEQDGRPGFSVLREGRKLRDMTMGQLRERFEILFGEAPGRHITALHLTKRILWRLQEIRYGGLTAESEKALEKASGEKLVRKAIEGGMSATDAFKKFGIL